MTDPIILADHAGVRLSHGKPKVNGVEIHYAIGGTGEPVFLLHGVPKTMSCWRHVEPLLTQVSVAADQMSELGAAAVTARCPC